MKREEREYAEVVPEATRKARLEQEATTLLNLPKDVRKLIMIQMDPIDMYMLYAGVQNHAFRRWCDEEFWSFAFPRIFPDATAPSYMRSNPRQKFFAYVIERNLFEVPQSIELRDTRMSYPDINVEYENITEESVKLDIEILGRIEDDRDGEKQIASAMFQGFMQTHMDIGDSNFKVYRFSRHYLVNIQGPVAEMRKFLRAEIFRLFRSGYGYRTVFFRNDTEVYRGIRATLPFLTGCHLCGSPTVTGYSAEDPSKLLCGPGCTTLKK